MSSTKSTQVLIVGAGIGGLTMAIALKRQLNAEDYVIVERASDVGGTWRGNMYPGCSSDIAIHFYSLSTDLYHGWDYTHGYQDQIQDYWRNLSYKYDVHRHIKFFTNLLSATWDDVKKEYVVVLEDVNTGEQQVMTTKILIGASGILEQTRIPDIPGLGSFKGKAFHCGNWDNGVNLIGKRVGVIGNGASATQMVPVISEDPRVEVVEFARTPNWFMPPIRSRYSNAWKGAFRWIPGFINLVRFIAFAKTELNYLLIFKTRFMHPLLTWMGRRYITQTSPKKYHEFLVPSYMLGCRRIIFDTDYLQALHRPNLTLKWDKIQRIDEDGLTTVTGEKFKFDVLVYATGYVTDSFALDIRGRTQTVKEYYEQSKGPKAHLAVTIPDFPNFFMVGGPNSTTGHTSVILFEEIQANLIIQLIKPIISGSLRSVEVTHEVTDRYNDYIGARLSKSVFMGCVSWYRVGREGRVFSIFPGSGTKYWSLLRKVRWSEYEGTPRETMEKIQRRQRMRSWLKTMMLLTPLLGLGVLALLVKKGTLDVPRTVDLLKTSIRTILHA